MTNKYGQGVPGARGAMRPLAFSLPEETLDFFGEMAARFNRENNERLTTQQFIEQYLIALAMADKKGDIAVTHRLRNPRL
jgi:hypothetical protein